jgi:hypothetical protein
VAFTPKKQLLTIKGISEAKADKILTEGKLSHSFSMRFADDSVQDGAYGVHDRYRNPFEAVRAGSYFDGIDGLGYDLGWWDRDWCYY